MSETTSDRVLAIHPPAAREKSGLHALPDLDLIVTQLIKPGKTARARITPIIAPAIRAVVSRHAKTGGVPANQDSPPRILVATTIAIVAHPTETAQLITAGVNKLLTVLRDRARV